MNTSTRTNRPFYTLAAVTGSCPCWCHQPVRAFLKASSHLPFECGRFGRSFHVEVAQARLTVLVVNRSKDTSSSGYWKAIAAARFGWSIPRANQGSVSSCVDRSKQCKPRRWRREAGKACARWTQLTIGMARAQAGRDCTRGPTWPALDVRAS